VSQEEACCHEQEQLEDDLENKCQLLVEFDDSASKEEKEESNDNTNSTTYTQNAFEARSVLAGGFLAVVDYSRKTMTTLLRTLMTLLQTALEVVCVLIC